MFSGCLGGRQPEKRLVQVDPIALAAAAGIFIDAAVGQNGFAAGFVVRRTADQYGGDVSAGGFAQALAQRFFGIALAPLARTDRIADMPAAL